MIKWDIITYIAKVKKIGVKSMFSIDDVKVLIKDDKIQWRNHILVRMKQRGIKIKDVIKCIDNGEIIEFYEDDYPFPSALILGFKDIITGIHVVCAIGQDYLWMITAYYPDKEQWSKDLKVRRKGEWNV